MKNAIVKLGFCLLFFFAALSAFGANPTVTVTQASSDPTTSGTIVFNVVFSESVTGFGDVGGDVVLSGGGSVGAAAGVTGSGANYTVTITGHTVSGPITVSIPAGAAQNGATQGNVASSGGDPTVTYDGNPKVTINKKGSQSDPTSGSTIRFTVVFSKPITPASFTLPDVNLSTSTTGAGTVSVANITVVTPNTDFEVEVTVSGAAIAGDVTATIGVGLVSDPAGNLNDASSSTDNTVQYITAPVVGAPTVINIDEDQADLGGSITSSGGAPPVSRGVYYDTNPIGTPSGTQNTNGTGLGSFSEAITGLTPETQYFFKAYGTNSVATTFSTQGSFWTLSAAPSSAPTPTLSATGTTSMHITFVAASTITNTEGWVILRKAGSEPPVTDLPDGVHPDDLGAIGSVLPGGSTLVARSTDQSATSYDDPGLTACTDYYYVYVLYNWDETNPETTNYRYGGATFNDANLGTWCNNSDIVTNGTISPLDFRSKTGATITTAADGLQVFPLRMRDGGGSNDIDDRKTELASITISINHPELLQAVAYIEGGYVQSQPAAASMLFNIPNNTTLANDNSNKDFAFYATFITSPVVDQTAITFTVTGATVRTGVNQAASGFINGSAGSATISPVVNVIATKLVFSGVTNPINPGNDFSLTVTAKDISDNVDTNVTGSVELTQTTGDGTFTSTDTPGALTRALSGGSASWIHLKFSTAGSKQITADHSGSIPNATQNVSVESLGTIVSGPTKELCFNNNSTVASTFVALGRIQMKESDGSDFAAGADQTYSLLLPPGFMFDVATVPFVGAAGSNISAPAFVGYTNNNVVRIKYSIGAVGGVNRDSVYIDNLKVKYSSTIPATPQPILRIGGTAVQVKNADTDAEPHGMLSADDDRVLSIKNTNGGNILPDQTAFSRVSDPPILLQAVDDGGPTVLTDPGVVFSGNGVVLDGTTYKFIPSTVPNGDYDITLQYTDPAAPGCISNVTTSFNVFSSIINGLQATYCVNDAPTVITTPVGSAPTGIFCVVPLGSPTYVDNDFTYKYYDFNFTWQDLPSQTSFNPADPAFADEIARDGYLYVSVWYNSQCAVPLGSQYGAVLTQVKFLQKPTISFSPTFPYGVCATDGAYGMVGSPYDNTNAFDEFWSSVSGAPGSPIPGITGDRTIGFSFQPQIANATAVDKIVQINYRHKDATTGCSNTVSVPINVWAKPNQVPASDIFIRGVPDLTAEFCHSESLTPFSTTPVTNVFHKWESPARPPVEGDEFALSPNDFPNTAGVPNVGEVATYKLSQITHRQFVTIPFFPFPIQVFAGCEGDPRNLTVTIMQPTTVDAGVPKTICEDNPLVLTSLGAGISSPTPGLGGTWSSDSAVPGVFMDADSPESGFGLALEYLPSDEEEEAGFAVLRLTTNDPSGPCGPVTDIVVITINPGVSVSFPVSPLRVCAADAIQVEGSLSNAVAFHWEVDTGLGTIASGTADDLITTYLPDDPEVNQGGVVKLKLETEDPDGPGPCAVVTGIVDVIISQPPRLDAGPDKDICADEDIVLEGVKPLTLSSATSWTWVTDGLGTITDPADLESPYQKDLTGIEDPGEQDAPSIRKITFIVTSNTPAFPNVCPAETDKVTFTLHARPKAPLPTDAAPTYCVGETVELLRASGTSLTWYDNTLSQISNGQSLSTSVTADAEKTETFHVSQTFDKVAPFPGCESEKVPITITVNPLPVPAFTIANQCLGDVMQFTDQSTLAQPPLGSRSIVSRQWNFDDGFGFTDAGSGPIPAGTQDGSTTGTYENPGHRFRNTGLYNARLVLLTSDGCTATLVHAPIKVGAIPQAKFASRLVCDQDNTQFAFTGADPEVGTTFSYAWDFGDPTTGSGNISTLKNPAHHFTGVGAYDVTLTVTTDLLCETTITTKTAILPYVKTFPYVESFETSTHGWLSEGFPETSWNLLSGTDHITPSSNPAVGANFWVTNTDVNGQMTYNNGERSVLYGPCVDMTALQRPVLSMDYWSDTEGKGDGAYIEVIDETLSNPQWIRLGDNTSGLNWYNESSVVGLAKTGNVGQDIGQFGWSGKSEAWKTGRYNLDAFSGKTRLRFRVVFGSNGNQPLDLVEPFDGFAIDYFKLETRNRLVLVENFTSKSTSTVVGNNTNAFKTFPSAGASSEVVKIEYHTGLPAATGDPADPIFTQNPMDPNARASFYGLSAVPRGYIDGYTNAEGAGLFGINPGNWASLYYSTESLVTSPLDIVINTPTITDGVINITGTVTAKEFELKANQYSLYVAVVEETVGSDAYVLRKMLPSASGRKVQATALGQSFTFNESWRLDKAYLTADPNLIAVAFVQSDIMAGTGLDRKKAVLQAAYNDNVPVVTFTTGVEVPLLEQTALYPNPADRLLNIELPKATATGVEVAIIDQLGRSVIRSSIGAGERSTTIDTGDLAGTVYIVQLKENGVYTNRRLLVTHRH